MHTHLAKMPGCEYAEGEGFDPADDYYHAIYVLKKTGKVHVLVFEGYKTRTPHDEAVAAMGPFGARLSCVDYRPSATDVKLRPPAPAWQCGEDLSIEVEERAMTTICDKLKLTKPADWRATREAIVRAHAVHAVRALQAQTRPRTPPHAKAPLRQCACGNFARPRELLCNACTKAGASQPPSAAAAAGGDAAPVAAAAAGGDAAPAAAAAAAAAGGDAAPAAAAAAGGEAAPTTE